MAGSPKGGLVIDPFCGSGTVGKVCKKFRRSFIGIDIKPEYIELSRKEIADTSPLKIRKRKV